MKSEELKNQNSIDKSDRFATVSSLTQVTTESHYDAMDLAAIDYVCELKIDGCALALTYENGLMTQTMKIKRKKVLDFYDKEISKLY